MCTCIIIYTQTDKVAQVFSMTCGDSHIHVHAQSIRDEVTTNKTTTVDIITQELIVLLCQWCVGVIQCVRYVC